MTSHDEQQRIRAQAAQWVVRIGEQSPQAALPETLRSWLDADPRHAQAFAEARRTWLELGALSFPTETAPALPRRGRRRRWRRLASAAVLLIAVGLLMAPMQRLVTPLLADHASGVGEIRHIQLADGSQVELDAQSAIDVDFDGQTRRIRLLSGQAIFTVAPMGPDEPRPFVVESAGGSSRALGTRFVVEEREQGAWVGVLQHSVEVRVAQAPGAGASRVLAEGQSAWYDASGIHPLRRDLANATAWREGLLVFEDRPLSEVVARLRQYRHTPLLILDGERASRRVSGVFRTDDPDRSLDLLASELGMSRVELGFLTLLR